MLNHKDKYIHFQLYQQSEFQKMYIAQKKTTPEELVLVNVISKAVLVQPVDISGVINASHCLEMLEEDNENWYFITSHLPGKAIFSPTAEPNRTVKGFSTQHFLQLMALVSTYDYLTPYYQMMLLKESQFILHNDQLVSREVFDLSFISKDLPDFTAVKTQLAALIAQGVNLLKMELPEVYGNVSWYAIFENANSLNSLKQITTYWSEEIEVLSRRIQPEVLENLYTIKVEKDSAPGPNPSQRRYATLPAKEESPTNRPAPEKRKNTAILLTGIIALCLIAASLAPKVIDYFNTLKTEQKTNDSKPVNDTASTNTGNASSETGNDDSGGKNASPENEQLQPKNIAFLNGLWAFDQTQFHTGDRSLKLTLDKNNTKGIVEFSNLTIPKNASLSLWMRSDKGGNIQAEFTFSKGNRILGTHKAILNFEAGEQWYLMNPISSTLAEEFSGADNLKIQLSGDANTLWLDDLLFESFK